VVEAARASDVNKQLRISKRETEALRRREETNRKRKEREEQQKLERETVSRLEQQKLDFEKESQRRAEERR